MNGQQPPPGGGYHPPWGMVVLPQHGQYTPTPEYRSAAFMSPSAGLNGSLAGYQARVDPIFQQPMYAAACPVHDQGMYAAEYYHRSELHYAPSDHSHQASHTDSAGGSYYYSPVHQGAYCQQVYAPVPHQSVFATQLMPQREFVADTRVVTAVTTSVMAHQITQTSNHPSPAGKEQAKASKVSLLESLGIKDLNELSNNGLREFIDSYASHPKEVFKAMSILDERARLAAASNNTRSVQTQSDHHMFVRGAFKPSHEQVAICRNKFEGTIKLPNGWSLLRCRLLDTQPDGCNHLQFLIGNNEDDYHAAVPPESQQVQWRQMSGSKPQSAPPLLAPPILSLAPAPTQEQWQEIKRKKQEQAKVTMGQPTRPTMATSSPLVSGQVHNQTNRQSGSGGTRFADCRPGQENFRPYKSRVSQDYVVPRTILPSQLVSSVPPPKQTCLDETPILNPASGAPVSAGQRDMALEVRSQRRLRFPRHVLKTNWCMGAVCWPAAGDAEDLRTMDDELREFFRLMIYRYRYLERGGTKLKVTPENRGMFAWVEAHFKSLKPLLCELFPENGMCGNLLVETAGNCYIWGLYFKIQTWIEGNPREVDLIGSEEVDDLPLIFRQDILKGMITREKAWRIWRDFKAREKKRARKDASGSKVSKPESTKHDQAPTEIEKALPKKCVTLIGGYGRAIPDLLRDTWGTVSEILINNVISEPLKYDSVNLLAQRLVVQSAKGDPLDSGPLPAYVRIAWVDPNMGYGGLLLWFASTKQLTKFTDIWETKMLGLPRSLTRKMESLRLLPGRSNGKWYDDLTDDQLQYVLDTPSRGGEPAAEFPFQSDSVRGYIVKYTKLVDEEWSPERVNEVERLILYWEKQANQTADTQTLHTLITLPRSEADEWLLRARLPTLSETLQRLRIEDPRGSLITP